MYIALTANGPGLFSRCLLFDQHFTASLLQPFSILCYSTFTFKGHNANGLETQLSS